MDHKKYKELIELNVLGELSKTEERLLENHLFECEECSLEQAEIKKLYSLISTEGISMPTEDELTNARKRLFNTINSEKEKHSKAHKTSFNWNKILLNKYSLGFGTIGLVLVGLFVGYLLFSNSSQIILTNNGIDLDKINSGEVKIANVNFPRKFSENGEFEFKLDKGKVTNYKGTLEDVVVQKLLASAIRETENPGLKIKTSKSFIEFFPNNFAADDEIKKAFIYSLKTDQNPGVRKVALQALMNFQYDEEIRDALLFVLEKDENAANRMSAISALLSVNLVFSNINEEVRNKLNQRNLDEENEVIKYKTAKLLIGGKSNEK